MFKWIWHKIKFILKALLVIFIIRVMIRMIGYSYGTIPILDPVIDQFFKFVISTGNLLASKFVGLLKIVF